MTRFWAEPSFRVMKVQYNPLPSPLIMYLEFECSASEYVSKHRKSKQRLLAISCMNDGSYDS